MADRASLALAIAVIAGAALASQSFMNGRLSRSLGSAPLAASLSATLSLVCTFAIAAPSGLLRRGIRALRESADLRPWHWLCGVLGGAMLGVSAYAAPITGVALLTVAIVCGQTAGGLAVDAAGLTPGRRRALSRPRVLGAALAVAAVAGSALTTGGRAELGLLVLVVMAGAGFAVQQAAIGQLNALGGQPLLASAIVFAVSGTTLALLALLVTGAGAPSGWDAPPWELAGGLLGVVSATAMAVAVPVIGVLRFSLGLVVGQSAAGLLLDLVAPTPGRAVTLGTVAGIALAVAAVAVSGRDRAPR
jgi:transporter family-2 protein